MEIGSILFCGAFDGEIDIIKKYKNLNVLKTGVGAFDTMYNLQKVLIRFKNFRSIVFLGSAGAYPHSNLKIGEIVYSNSFTYREIGEFRKLIKVPKIINRNILTELEPHVEPLTKKFKEVVTNSTNYITLEDIPLDECIDFYYDVGVENMEGFPIAYIASKFNLPFTAFYGVTNMVGSKGSDDWVRNWREASNHLQREVLSYFLT